jgi:hypothetical protein
MKRIIVLLIAFVAYGQMALAQEPAIVSSAKPGWHKIGEVKADFKTESESISVLGNDKFASIKLKVTDATITIDKVVVYFEDDRMQEIPISGTIQAGKETKVYNLQDPTQEIKKVTFTYRSRPNSQEEKAHVELYGLKEAKEKQ